MVGCSNAPGIQSRNAFCCRFAIVPYMAREAPLNYGIVVTSNGCTRLTDSSAIRCVGTIPRGASPGAIVVAEKCAQYTSANTCAWIGHHIKIPKVGILTIKRVYGTYFRLTAYESVAIIHTPYAFTQFLKSALVHRGMCYEMSRSTVAQPETLQGLVRQCFVVCRWETIINRLIIESYDKCRVTKWNYFPHVGSLGLIGLSDGETCIFCVHISSIG